MQSSNAEISKEPVHTIGSECRTIVGYHAIGLSVRVERGCQEMDDRDCILVLGCHSGPIFPECLVDDAEGVYPVVILTCAHQNSESP